MSLPRSLASRIQLNDCQSSRFAKHRDKLSGEADETRNSSCNPTCCCYRNEGRRPANTVLPGCDAELTCEFDKRPLSWQFWKLLDATVTHEFPKNRRLVPFGSDFPITSLQRAEVDTIPRVPACAESGPEPRLHDVPDPVT